MEGKIIKTAGQAELVTPRNWTDFQLEELREIVGGHIEIVHLKGGRYMVANEDGLALGLPDNPVAGLIALLESEYPNNGNIVGNVLICEKSMIK